MIDLLKLRREAASLRYQAKRLMTDAENLLDILDGVAAVQHEIDADVATMRVAKQLRLAMVTHSNIARTQAEIMTSLVFPE